MHQLIYAHQTSVSDKAIVVAGDSD